MKIFINWCFQCNQIGSQKLDRSDPSNLGGVAFRVHGRLAVYDYVRPDLSGFQHVDKTGLKYKIQALNFEIQISCKTFSSPRCKDS